MALDYGVLGVKAIMTPLIATEEYFADWWHAVASSCHFMAALWHSVAKSRQHLVDTEALRLPHVTLWLFVPCHGCFVAQRG